LIRLLDESHSWDFAGAERAMGALLERRRTQAAEAAAE
jgi:hypothetical protein